MKQINFATTNPGKVASMNRDLIPLGIEVTHHNIDMPEPRSYDLQLIALEKVKFAFNKINKPCIANDSGFYIHSLNGFPKSFTNFALSTIGIEGIIQLLKEESHRECEFRNCTIFYSGELEAPVYFESENPGRISEEIKGETNPKQWSELWKIFIPNGYNKTLAEMTEDEFINYQNNLSPSSIVKFGKWYQEAN